MAQRRAQLQLPEQFRGMAFAQPASRESHRDIEAPLNCVNDSEGFFTGAVK